MNSVQRPIQYRKIPKPTRKLPPTPIPHSPTQVKQREKAITLDPEPADPSAIVPCPVAERKWIVVQVCKHYVKDLKCIQRSPKPFPPDLVMSVQSIQPVEDTCMVCSLFTLRGLSAWEPIYQSLNWPPVILSLTDELEPASACVQRHILGKLAGRASTDAM